MKKKVFLMMSIFIFCMEILIPMPVRGVEKEDIFQKVEAPYLLLAETDTGNILYERNGDEKIYPASLTKLMTAILVVENCELDEIVTVSENAINSVPSGYVNANLQVEEELTVEDLLYVMLIPSANDAANALAEFVGGNIESFATMMNTKAKELGCTGSNFLNPSGLHQEEHFTTIKDLMLISRAAIQYPIIRKIIATTSYTLPSTNAYTKDARIFTSTNYMKLKNLTKFYCDYCIGGKTGYTGEAKNCVVEFAEKEGVKLTAIVMGENSKVKGQKFLDAKEMFEYVFDHYDVIKVTTRHDICETKEVWNATRQTRQLEVLYQEDLSILMSKNMDMEIKKEIKYEKLKAPIQKGEKVGKIIFQSENEEYTVDLIAAEQVEETKLFKNGIAFVMIASILYIIHLLKKSKTYHKKHGKKIRK